MNEPSPKTRLVGGRFRARTVSMVLIGMLAAGTLALAACTGTLAPAAAGTTAPAPLPSVATPSPYTGTYNPNTDPVVLAVRKVEPAVVNVTTNVVEQNPFGGAQIGKGVGTGFIVRSDGIVLTNYHVVEGGMRIQVRFNSTAPADVRGKTFAARVIGGDNSRDLAVLQLEGVSADVPLPTVPLGDSARAVVGERVLAIGYALALPGGPTVTSGILSSTARTIQVQDENSAQGQRTYQDALQTDAAINPGNSGGPLVDLNGNVVGINTAGNSQAQNIGFAIAIDGAKPILQQALKDPAGVVAYLGVSTAPVSEVQAGSSQSHGAVVVALAPNGPAQQAGIRAGDVIVEFDGKSVTGPDDLGTDIRALRPGDRVAVQVAGQNGSTRTVEVTLGTNPLPSAG